MRRTGLPRAVAVRALSTARRGSPYVLWTPEVMNGGNHLYLWLTAWARRERGEGPWAVLHRPKMDPWLREFPALRRLTVLPQDVGFLSRRSVEWGQQVGTDFLKADILPFVREVLLTGSAFPERVRCAVPNANVINVRRGDYYSDPRNRGWYGMDVRGYVRRALERIPGPDGQPTILVSDDPRWCQEHLTDLPGLRRAEVLPGPHDVFADLAQLAAARQLVLANSTFSYWGGYLASCRPPGDRPELVQAPLHFNRKYGRGESTLLLDQWLAIPPDEY